MYPAPRTSVDAMSELAITTTNGVISINDAEVRADVERFMATYQPREIVDADSYKLADDDRKRLNRESKFYDEQRLSTTRQLDSLKQQIIDTVRDITRPITEASESITQAQTIFKAQESQRRMDHLTGIYKDMAPILVGCIPPSEMIEDAWLDIKSDLSKAEDALVVKIEEIARGEATVDQLLKDSPLKRQVKAHYFQSQDLTEAINYLNKLKADLAAVDRLEREKAALNSDTNIAESQQEPDTDTQDDNRTYVPIETETAPQIALESFVLEFTCPLDIAMKAARLIRGHGYMVTKFRSVV